MARAFTPKVVTANDLLEGDVIYQTEDDRWSRELSDAELITDEAHAQVRLLDAARQANKIVGAYRAVRAQGHCALQHVFEFTDIAWPVIGHH